MWRSPVVKTAATAEPVPLDDAKIHLRVDHATDDGLISALLASARAHVESVTGQKLAEQVLTIRCDDWSDLALLPVAPIASIAFIKYADAAGDVQTVPAGDYEPRLEGLQPQVVTAPGATWPAKQNGSLITVEVEAGYAADETPPELLAAIKLILGDLYAFRESGQVGSVSTPIQTSATVEALMTNHRIYLV